MNHDTKACALPALTADFLCGSEHLIDNLFAGLWKTVGMKTLLERCGFHKRSGVAVNPVLYCLTMWVWLKSNSVSLFARDSLRTFCAAGKDVLYEAMNREDWNWRVLNLRVACKTVQQWVEPGSVRAFVLDDTIKIRSGKKMPGISSHFDHTTGRHVMGQQVLTLGLSCSQGFVPIDSELFTGKTNVVGLPAPFKDGRSIAAVRHRTAVDQTKPQMARAMIARAQRAGIEAQYLLADAWFGTRKMIAVAQDALLRPIVRMKNNKMKYRHTLHTPDKVVHQELDLARLYQSVVRGRWEKIPNQQYQSRTVVVELNLNDAKEDARWVKVRLLFVRGVCNTDKVQAGKHDWCVFLTTDTHLDAQKMLQIYSMRWAIEVYFKESKQHLGFMQEQARHYACYIASIHLTAIRFCLLVIAKQQHGVKGVALMRQQMVSNATHIDYASKLWGCCFRSLIVNALDKLKPVLGDNVDLAMNAIDLHVQAFFAQALQLEPFQLRLESS